VTSGTRIIDQRRPAAGGLTESDCFGNVFSASPSGSFGFYSERTWSGSNSPKTEVDRTQYSWQYSYADAKGRRKTKTFRHRKPHKVLQENGYSMTLFQRADVEYQIVSPCPDQPGHIRNTWSSTSGFSGNLHTDWNDNDDINLLGKLRERIQGDSFNLLVAAGEGREALSTIADGAKRITRAAKKLRKGDLLGAARTFVNGKRPKGKNISRSEVTEDWFASNWLQLQYGWIPLVKDCFAAAKHLAFMQNRPTVKVYRSAYMKGGRDNKPVSPSPSYVLSGQSIRMGSVKAIITHINEAALAGLEDPLSLAWEKLPYSFVADWFIPIGNYLSASALARSLTGTYVISRFDKLLVNGVAVSPSVTNYYFAFGAEGWFYKSVQSSREIRSVLPVPFPDFKGRDKIASWMHATNAAALITNAFPRFSKR
jgi:hypothetical protein